MKEIEIVRRETLILSPGEIYLMPDNIAGQITKRGSGKEIEKSTRKNK